MKIRKIISLFMIVSLCSMFVTPFSIRSYAEDNTMTLGEFLKTTENIEAKYLYPSMVASTATTGKTPLSAHTPIVIRCVDTITTKDIVSGGTVNFAVVSDIKSQNGTTLIKAGTPVTAQISFSKSKGMVGQSGEITITDFSTTAVDGTYIPLSGSVLAQPDDKMTMSIVLSVLICPLFLLMKGDDAQVTAGTTKTAYTVSEVYIKADRL